MFICRLLTLDQLNMSLSTDDDFLSGIIKTGVYIVPAGVKGFGLFDLECLHKRSLKWGGEDDPPVHCGKAGGSNSKLKLRPKVAEMIDLGAEIG